MNKAVFLDRDGVINETFVVEGKLVTPRTAEEFRILPGVKKALITLKDKGYYIFVVTNQPEIRRGLLTREELDRMHAVLVESLPVEKIYVCLHDDEDGCDCRKPKPGLLLQAASEWGINLSASYMVGDRWKDIEAGAAAGCTTVLVKTLWSEEEPPGRTVAADHTVENLTEAVRIILASNKTETEEAR